MLSGSDLVKENVKLRYQLDEALTRITYLESLLAIPSEYPQELNLGPKEKIILNCLHKSRGVCLNVKLLDAAGYGEGYKNPKILQVYIHWLRKKLAPLNIKIATIWGEGYMIDAENRTKLNAAIAAKVSLMTRSAIDRQRRAVA